MGVVTWQDAKYADGRGVAAWVFANVPRAMEDPSTARRLYEWKIGGTASFLCVDRMMVRFDRHVSELPDEVWLAERPGREKHEKRVVAARPPVKMCAGCGGPISYRKPCGDARGAVEYARMRFCSRVCSAEVLTGNRLPVELSVAR